MNGRSELAVVYKLRSGWRYRHHWLTRHNLTTRAMQLITGCSPVLAFSSLRVEVHT